LTLSPVCQLGKSKSGVEEEPAPDVSCPRNASPARRAQLWNRDATFFIVQRQEVQPEFCAPPDEARPGASCGISRPEL